MKILMVTADGFPHTGGVEKHIHMVSQEIVKMGHKVDVVFLSKTKMKKFIKDGVTYRPYKAILGNTHLFNLKYILHVLKASKKYNVIHFQGLHKPLPVFMLFLLQNNTVGKVFTTHYHGEGHSLLANIAHVFYTPLVYPVINQVDALIAVSEFEKNVLQVSFPQTHSKTHVVYNGVNFDECEHAENTDLKEPLRVLFVSRLEKYKNIHKALPHMPEGSHVHIVGDGNYREEIQEVAFKNSNINFTFHGAVSDKQLCELWKEADVYVNMSDKEAFGLTVVEALTHNVPVVCANIPAFVEVKKITKSRNIKIVNNMNELTANITRLAKKGFVQDSMVLPTWSKAALDTVGIYEQIIGRKQ